MAYLGQVTKQPAERKDWDLEYASWLTPGDSLEVDGISVVISTFAGTSVTPLAVYAVAVDGTRAKVWLSGGTDGVVYKITVTTTTADGRIQQDEFRIKVKDS